MNTVIRSTFEFLLLAITLLVNANAQERPGWPIEPTATEHPLGNTLGEFQYSHNEQFPGAYQHMGIDILAKPHDSENPDDDTVPWVIVTVGGTVKYLSHEPNTRDNELKIIGNDGIEYTYDHLWYEYYDPQMVIAYDNNATVVLSAGDPIAHVAPYGCPYDHLHYGLSDGTKYLNPLRAITPNPDSFAPRVIDLDLAVHNGNPWSKLNSPGVACTVVRGRVDIITRLVDRDDAASTQPGANNVGVYNLRWRACPKSTPNCDAWNETHAFEDMLIIWGVTGNTGTKEQFSTTPDWVSDADECSPAVSKTFMVPTGNSASGGWDTTAHADGSYSVTVEASDVAGNVTVRNIHACIQNGAGCTTDLAIRDGIEDTGAVPYTGSPSWLSPDITVNQGTRDENRNINSGKFNSIKVVVWNTGSCTLPLGTNYKVCLGWIPPSASATWPMPSASATWPIPNDRTVACQDKTVQVSGWAPGKRKATAFTWKPTAGSIPSGIGLLVAWSVMEGDPAQTTPSAALDNNRAQRYIKFAPPP